VFAATVLAITNTRFLFWPFTKYEGRIIALPEGAWGQAAG